MTLIERIGFDPSTERELFYLSLSEPDDLPKTINLASKHFACFIAWDSELASVEEISCLVEPLLDYGAAYFCTWGPGCERVHDIIDEIDAFPSDRNSPTEDAVIMTTWHAKESLEEALCFFLTTAWPDEYFEATLKSSLAICIGSHEWSSVIRDALAKPEDFLKRFIG